MSIWYDLYLEGKVDGEWRAIGPFMKGGDGELRLMPVLSGQSFVGEALDDIGCWSGMPKDISGDVRALLEVKDDSSGEDVGGWNDPDRWTKSFLASEICADPARFEHEAYVSRECANGFELGELSHIWEWITPEEYGMLPPEERRAYTYFRWSNRLGSYETRCRLKALINELTRIYEESVLLSEDYNKNVSESRVIVRVG